MKKQRLILLLFVLTNQAIVYATPYPAKNITDTIPAMVKGNFMDDYGIQYSVTDTLFMQLPNVKYHIISWDTTAQYLLARNDDKNPSEPGLYTRIDYMRFNNMAPFYWGFCLTTYNAKTIEEAKMKAKVDRENPRKGCNGYPFSRMKRKELH
jgi:hypothetical protein